MRRTGREVTEARAHSPGDADVDGREDAVETLVVELTMGKTQALDDRLIGRVGRRGAAALRNGNVRFRQVERQQRASGGTTGRWRSMNEPDDRSMQRNGGRDEGPVHTKALAVEGDDGATVRRERQVSDAAKPEGLEGDEEFLGV